MTEKMRFSCCNERKFLPPQVFNSKSNKKNNFSFPIINHSIQSTVDRATAVYFNRLCKMMEITQFWLRFRPSAIFYLHSSYIALSRNLACTFRITDVTVPLILHDGSVYCLSVYFHECVYHISSLSLSLFHSLTHSLCVLE